MTDPLLYRDIPVYCVKIVKISKMCIDKANDDLLMNIYLYLWGKSLNNLNVKSHLPDNLLTWWGCTWMVFIKFVYYMYLHDHF